MQFFCFYFQNFLNSSSCPEIQGYLHLKEPGRKSWKKLYMFLRRSGLYYSTKGTSKVPIYCSREQEMLLCAKYCVAKLTPLALFIVIYAFFREIYHIQFPVIPPDETGAPTPSAAVRSGRQQHLHRHHGKETSQRSHGLPVLHQGNARRRREIIRYSPRQKGYTRLCVCVCVTEDTGVKTTQQGVKHTLGAVCLSPGVICGGSPADLG